MWGRIFFWRNRQICSSTFENTVNRRAGQWAMDIKGKIAYTKKNKTGPQNGKNGVTLLAKTIVAIFEVYAFAEKAAIEIKEKGLRTDNISIIAKDNGNMAYYKPGNKGKLVINEVAAYPFKLSRRERVSDGIITGGIFGGVFGIIAGAASMFIPQLGLVAAGGPISGLLAGLALGGIIGGILDVSMPKYKRVEYEKLISNGNVLFSMKVDEERMESIVEIIKENGALSVEKY